MEYLNRISPWYFLIVAFLTTLALVWFGAEGVRGTDQYWYIADVERIANGERPITNTFFPGEMLRQNALPENNYIFHNSPMLYIVAMFTSVLSTYHAWIVANLICHLLVAVSLFSIARKVTDLFVATGVTVFYLISPVAIWQTINPLLEMYYSALLSLVLLCFFYRQTLFFQYALWLLLALGVVSHPIFLIAAFLYGLIWLYENRHLNKSFLVPLLIGYYAVFYFLLQHKDAWFPSSFLPSLTAIMSSTVPGISNMFWYFTEVPPEVNSELMLSKVVSALRRHTLDLKFLPFYMFTNLGILSALLVSALHFKRWWLVLLPMGFFGSQYLAMLFLMQNHPRLQQIIAVVTFTMLAIALFQWKKSSLVSRLTETRTPVCMLWVCLVLVNCYMVHSARNESVEQRNDLAALTKQTDQFVATDVRLVSIDVKPHNPFASVVLPADVLFVRTSMLNDEQIARAINLFGPHFIIAPEGFSVQDWGAVEVYTKLSSNRFGDFIVYSVNPS